MDQDSTKLDEAADSAPTDIELTDPNPESDTSADSLDTSPDEKDTGESEEGQAEPPVNTPEKPADDSAEEGSAWIGELNRFHNNMNELLYEKENLKIVAVNKSAKPSFYKQWSKEANNVLRITAILRRRLNAATKKVS